MRIPIFYFICLTTIFTSCKRDKPLSAPIESISVNDKNAPMLNIEVIQRPTDADNGDYIEVNSGEVVKIEYSGIEKEKVIWTHDGLPLGETTGLSTTHTWTEPGIKEIKAILQNGDERIVYVMVKESELTAQVHNPELTLEPVPDPTTPTITNGVSSNQNTNLIPSKPDKITPPAIDSDGDSVPDEKDLCKDQYGPKKFKGCPDSDGDSIPDNEDACPNEKGTKLFKGCSPPPVSDRDGDGVPDKEDKCPDKYGDKSNNGCPKDPPPVSDRDGDGVPDKEDKCPDKYGDKSNNGCPKDPPPVADRDGDGVRDKDDKCPDQKGTINGCPDSDGDGILDHEDKCKNEKGAEEFGGCPPPAVFVAKSSASICGLVSQAALDDEKVTGSSGSITIKPAQDLILHEAKLVASGHGKIDISLEGGDIKKDVSIVKSVNPGNNTIRMNDFKNTVLRAGKTYTLIYQTQADVQVTQIKNAYASGMSDSRVSMSGKNIFYDVVYKY